MKRRRKQRKQGVIPIFSEFLVERYLEWIEVPASPGFAINVDGVEYDVIAWAYVDLEASLNADEVEYLEDRAEVLAAYERSLTEPEPCVADYWTGYPVSQMNGFVAYRKDER